jgi:hypothetical protein
LRRQVHEHTSVRAERAIDDLICGFGASQIQALGEVAIVPGERAAR